MDGRQSGIAASAEVAENPKDTIATITTESSAKTRLILFFAIVCSICSSHLLPVASPTFLPIDPSVPVAPVIIRFDLRRIVESPKENVAAIINTSAVSRL
jgi:hypothetical protein